MKAINIFTLIVLLTGAIVNAAPEVLTYSGRLTSSGTPYSGSAQFKFALVDRTGNFSYWSNHGQFSNPQEPSAFVTVPVNDGIYSVKLGDTSLQNMQVLSGSIFRDHNDAHLRIWVRLGSSGAFEMLSPDQPVTSVPYSLGGNGLLAANPSSGGSVSNGSGGSTHSVSGPQSIGSASVGAYARLVANGPTQPSATLILLTGDSADIVTYYADQPGRLEYAFGAHTFAFPKAGESLADQKTLVGPASVRLVAPTGTKNVAILQVKRADGRDPTKLEGAPAPPPDGQNPVTAPPAIVSVPSTRSVARGGTTTLFVSASGENLSYQWKKNGQNIAGATSSALPLENATGADAGQYVVQVTNPNGTVSSQAITVTVKMPVVPAGVYRINNSAGNSGHEVALTSFSIDQHEVTKAFWDEVYTWAIANGYDFSNAGIAEGPEYPVHSINWYDCVKWANALSERDGHTPCYYSDNNCSVVYRSGQIDLTNYNVKWNANGYRLPTETEWEVAARGGLVGSKYAWGESPSTTRANFDQTLHGATIPVGSFPSNGYGLYEIGGNLREWTWDWNDPRTYEYDFKESFIDQNGTIDSLIDHETNASYDWAIGSSSQITALDADYKIVKSYLTNDYINSVKARFINFGNAKIRFNYIDGTFFEAEFAKGNTTGSEDFTFTNTKNYKLVSRLDIFIRKWAQSGSSSYDFTISNVTIDKSFLAANSGIVNVSLLVPNYKENNQSFFKLEINADREDGDDIWFELVGDSNVSKTYAGTEFGKLLPLPIEVPRPKKLRILIKATPSNPTFGATALRSVIWTQSNPKSHWTGTERVIRDNHYAEALENLGKRSFSTPDWRFSTVGFRLVQRP